MLVYTVYLVYPAYVIYPVYPVWARPVPGPIHDIPDIQGIQDIPLPPTIEKCSIFKFNVLGGEGDLLLVRAVRVGRESSG